MKAILIGVALAASMLPASAYEIREYVARDMAQTDRPGREYVVTVGKPARQVRVIEGAPRWSEQRTTVVQEPRRVFDEIYGALGYPY